MADQLPTAIDPVTGDELTVLGFLQRIRTDVAELAGNGGPGGDPGDPPPSGDVTLTVTRVDDADATASWTTTRTDITGWTIARDGTDSEGEGAWSTELPADARSQSFGLLVGGQEYTITLTPHTASGDLPAVSKSTDGSGTDPGNGDPGNPPPSTGDGTEAAKLLGWGGVTWGDEFNYTGPLNPSKWSAYDGPGHDDNGIRSPAAFSVNGDFARCHGDPGGTTGGCAYQGYSSVYHRVEVRARMAADGSGSGEQYHPVLIMWPDSDEWPQGGEYDFAESDIGDTRMGAFMHHPADSVIQEEYNSGPLDLTQWHNYAFECSRSGLRAWIDGQPFFTDTNSGAYPPPGPMHLTWQLDNFGGSSHKGANLDVMWVRGYAAPA